MKIYHQSTFDRWPFEDKSIQAIITSPPYYNLRKYDIPDIVIGGNPECEHEWGITKGTHNVGRDDCYYGGSVNPGLSSKERKKPVNSSFCLRCNVWKGQYGLEPTYKLYIEHTLLWCQEAWRVLRDDGCFFLNLGDSWNGSNRGHGMNFENLSEKQKSNYGTRELLNMPLKDYSLPNKCLLDIPFRVSIKLVDELGFIKRNNIVWYSPNKMPESVTDRFSKKHEMIFLLVKNPEYYFDLDAVREKWDEDSIARLYRGNSGDGKYSGEIYGGIQPSNTMSTRRPNKTHEYKTMDPERKINLKGKNPGDVFVFNTQPSSEKHYAMWPQALVKRMILCSTRPGDSILDPFCGSGTTLRVADELNRIAYGIDLGYESIQRNRLSNIQKELIL